MKRMLFIVMLLGTMLLFMASAAMAETDPVVCSMEVTPSRLAGPGTVDVTITISNSGNTDMKDPLTLHNPLGQIISDFGTDGAVTLKAGETQTWKGKWDVNQRTLDSGTIAFLVKYRLYKDDGQSYSQSQPIRGKIYSQGAAADVEIRRTISPTIAREGQEITVKYDVSNVGTIALENITVQENKEINKEVQKIPALNPGETAQVKFTVKMGKKNLTSSATVTYQSADSSKKEQKKVDAEVITYGEPAMNATLTSSVKGVMEGEKVTLTLELKNKGTVDYTNLRVTDPTLGEVFSNQSLAKSESLKLEKEVTLTASTEYQFTISAIDNTGTEVGLATDPLKVEVLDPDKELNLAVEMAVDRTEVYEQPGRVRFTVTVTNSSDVEAKDVAILHGTTKIYTFASIAPGESRRLTRDAALSMAGKYQFTASTVDAIGRTLAFASNEVQIAFSVPTPAPATPTPPPNPTQEPTFSPVTMPPINDPSIASIPKVVQQILLPILILSALALVGSGVLLVIATKRRADQKKASEAAYDHLERSKRRDYITPTEPEEDLPKDNADKKPRNAREDGRKGRPGDTQGDDLPLDDVELPHLKYVRSAFERSNEGKQSYQGAAGSLYDDELYEQDDMFTRPDREGVMYEEASDGGYGGGYADAYDEDAQDSAYAQDGYDDGYYDDYDEATGAPYQEAGDTMDESYENAQGYDYQNIDGDVPENDAGNFAGAKRRQRNDPQESSMGY